MYKAAVIRTILELLCYSMIQWFYNISYMAI